MTPEGGHLPWKRQEIDQGRGRRLASYANLQDPLPEPPEGMHWTQDKETREWSLERKMEEDVFAKEIPKRDPRYIEHDVQSSDTFTGICLRYKISPAELRKANGGFSGTNLFLAPNPLKIPKRETEQGAAAAAQENGGPSSGSENADNGTQATAIISSDEDNDDDSVAVRAVFEESLRFEQSQPSPQTVTETIPSSNRLYPPIESVLDMEENVLDLETTWEAASTKKAPSRVKSCCDDDQCNCSRSRPSSSTGLDPHLAFSNPHAAVRATSLRGPSPYGGLPPQHGGSFLQLPFGQPPRHGQFSHGPFGHCPPPLHGPFPYGGPPQHGPFPYGGPPQHGPYPYAGPRNGPFGHGGPFTQHGPFRHDGAPPHSPFGHGPFGHPPPHVPFENCHQHQQYHQHGGQPPRDSEEEDNLLAMKMAAYEGRDATPVARRPDQHAEATVVDYYEHPSDASVNAVQADLVGQDYGAHYEENHHAQPTQLTAEASGYVESVQSVMATAASGEATEATVIESGPMDKVPADAWDASATEALVLEDSTSDFADLDSKPPAVEQWRSPAAREPRREMNATQDTAAAEATVVEFEDHPSCIPIASNAIHAEFVCQDYGDGYDDAPAEQYNLHTTRSRSSGVAVVDQDNDRNATEATILGSSNVNGAWQDDEAEFMESNVGTFAVEDGIDSGPSHHEWRSSQGSGANVAEVVDITEEVHPSELVDNAARAELIDTDSSSAIPIPSNHHREESSGGSSSQAPAEEVQVLYDSPDDVAVEAPELKETPDADSQWRSRDSSGGSYVVPDGEAEIVGITENVHPSELVPDATQAELIGTDSGCAVAVRSNRLQSQSERHQSDSRVGDAGVVVEQDPDGAVRMGANPEDETFEPREAQATIISEQDFTDFDRRGSTIAEATVENENTQSMTPATPVTILPEQIDEEAFNDSPQKSEVPLAARTPIGRSSPSFSLEDRSRSGGVAQPERTRTPSFRGFQQYRCPRGASPAVAAVEVNDSVNPNRPRATSDVVVASEPLNSSNSRLQAFSPSSFARNTGSVVVRSTTNVMDLLFGNRDNKLPDESLGRSVYPRTLLPSTVIYSDATKTWVTTVNTNQKALETNNVQESSKAVRAFSVPTRKQALCLARAWSPPKMHPFEENPACCICESQFNVFKRASHCRNCGVCICNSCNAQWLPKMLPNTYNIKRESMMNTCSAGRRPRQSSGTSFDGKYKFDNSICECQRRIIVSPTLSTYVLSFCGVIFVPKEELTFAFCLLLKWLIEEHCCPLRSIRISSGRPKDSSETYTPILTSRGRSLLAIALENRNIDIVQYLVVKKRMQISAEKGLSKEILSQNLDLVLRVLPEDVFSQQPQALPDDAMITRHTSLSTISGSESGGIQPSYDHEFDGTINDGREEISAVSTVWPHHVATRFVVLNVAKTYPGAQCVQWSAPSCEYTDREVGTEIYIDCVATRFVVLNVAETYPGAQCGQWSAPSCEYTDREVGTEI
eukprot:scaffold5276_cov134-Cylindrotheca_fusiformis.AAC.9